MDDLMVIHTALLESDLDAVEITAGMRDPITKQSLIDNTTRSVAMGSFGSPTFYVNDEIFFGKDRLTDMEQEIMRRR